jgi:hypothetical protein
MGEVALFRLLIISARPASSPHWSPAEHREREREREGHCR